MDPDESRRLIEELRAGSATAFNRVYAAERGRIYGFLLRLSRDPNVAADLFQNTWLKLARNAAALRPDTNIRAWLFSVARNEHANHCRAQMLDMSRILTLGRESPEPSTDADATAELDAVQRALAALSVQDREVLLLTVSEGFEAQRTAQILGLSYAALRQRLARARSRFVEQLRRDGGELSRATPHGTKGEVT